MGVNEKVGDGLPVEKAKVTIIREYEEGRDKEGVVELERVCEFGHPGKPSLVTDILGDPSCRIRHFPISSMLVAEHGGEIVGVIRGCVKIVTNGKNTGDTLSYVKLAYILGLRISPAHRRYGIGTKLVEEMEESCRRQEAQYVYMATDCGNEASIKLFTGKLGYTKYCTPTVLVQPVHAHHKSLHSSIAITRATPQLAESIYRRIFAGMEFFPEDMGSILSSKLNLGTYIALPKSYLRNWDAKKELPPSFAILSVWNTKDVYRLQLKGVSKVTQALCLGSRLLDFYMPWLRVPSIPNMFSPFGFYFLYGLHMKGKGCKRLMRSLCNFVHNMASDDVKCGAVVTEVARRDGVCEAIPHWKRFSWSEDLWFMKRLEKEESIKECEQLGWSTLQASPSVIFVDPRDF